MTFNNFKRETRLRDDELAPWEDRLRLEFLEVLETLGRPLPLSEWIDHRIGGEVETFKDREGGISIRLRGGRGKPQNKKSGKDPFFERLPADKFWPVEEKLRDAIFDFLVHWRMERKATLDDMCRDSRIETIRTNFIPKSVTLKEWIERRMGEEVLFINDRFGRSVVDVTKKAQAIVRERHEVVFGAAANDRARDNRKDRDFPDNPADDDMDDSGGPGGRQRKRRRRDRGKDHPIEIHPDHGQYKGVLESFCCRLRERCTKEDIQTDILPVGDGQFEATIRLNFLEGQQFTTEPHATESAAKAAAAKLAVLEISDQITEYNATLADAQN